MDRRIRPEFDSPNHDDPGISLDIALAFSQLLDDIDKNLANSREKSLVITKLQEAHFFAQIAPRK